jgi:hypothetical protein
MLAIEHGFYGRLRPARARQIRFSGVTMPTIFGSGSICHAAAVTLWFMYYNFCRVHQTLRVTPAMEAGIATHIWAIEELVGLLVSKDAVIAGI